MPTLTEPQTAPPADQMLAIYNPIRASIEKEKEINAKLVFIYSDPKGNASARSHIHKLRSFNGQIERARKQIKSEVLRVGKLIDSSADELFAEVDAMIAVHETPIKELERIAAEERAAVKAERQAQLAEYDCTAEIANLADMPAEEFAKLLETHKAKFLENLETQRQLEEERAEAARIKAENAELLRKQEADRIAREAADKSRQEAEEKARREREELERKSREDQERLLQAEREKIEAQRRELEAREQAERDRKEADERQKVVAAQAERERIAAEERAKVERERAVQQARDEEARKAEQARLAEEQRKREEAAAEAERVKKKRVRTKIVNEIADSICETVSNIAIEDCKLLAEAMLDGKIARVTVNTAA